MKTDVIDNLEIKADDEGMCFGNYSRRAKACKECLVWKECKEDTDGRKKEESK